MLEDVVACGSFLALAVISKSMAIQYKTSSPDVLGIKYCSGQPAVSLMLAGRGFRAFPCLRPFGCETWRACSLWRR
jgi:hypothetical protein